MDFGIAKMAADRKLTQTGTTVGSLYYMSPEQINGTEGMDARSDLYSLGVTLYEVATGARPFQGDSEYSIMAAHLQGSPRPPIQISPGLLPGLSEIIMMAIEKDPGKRFQTADAFRNALGIVGGRPRPAGPAEPTVAVPVPAAASRPGHRGLWMSIGALVVLVVLAVVAQQIPRFRHTAAQTDPAESDSATAQAPVPVPSPNAPAQAPLEAPAQNVPSPAEPAVAPEVPKAVAKTATPAPATPAAAPAPAPSAAPVPPAPTEDPQIAEQLKGVRDQLDLLHIRAAGVRTSLDGLRRQQAASGLNLRADMASSAQRMDYHLSQTQSALSRRDPEAAKRSLDAAEREVSNLEDFLHR